MICSLFIKSQTWLNVTTDYINNPSFEEYSACPQKYSTPGNLWIDSCIGWTAATNATSDYLNACANGLYPLAGVPNNIPMVNQLAYHGNGYCGFIANSLAASNMWCEYIQTTLINKFVIGKRYRFTMRIIPSKTILYGVSRIGVHFSSSKLTTGYQETSFKFTPTLLNSKGVIEDTTKWFLFDEEFTATGNENIVTIGWFGDTLTSDNGYYDTILAQIIYRLPYYAVDSINLLESKIKEFNINVLTPNNDGVNDILDFSEYNFKNLKFELYNRWGNLVFNTNDVNLKWGGLNNKGIPLTDGVYFYIINAEIPDIKDKIQKNGYLSIIH